jgi:hypothetical protein
VVVVPYADPEDKKAHNLLYSQTLRTVFPEEMKKKQRERDKRYQRNHPGIRTQIQRRYRRNHPEVRREADKRYYLKHSETMLAKRKIHYEMKGRSAYRQKRDAVIALLGGKCAECPVTDVRLLQINHKNGGGWKELHEKTTTWRFLTSILNGARSTQDLDLRCANHNILYEYETGRRN